MRFPIQCESTVRSASGMCFNGGVKPQQQFGLRRGLATPEHPFVGGFTTGPTDGSARSKPINHCGKAACLCKGQFCADLIDKGYCSEFTIGGGQGLCTF